MAAEYQLRLSDPWGNNPIIVGTDQITKLAYTRTTNAVGSLTLTTTRDAISDAYVNVDARIEVWRKPDGGTWTLEGDGPFLIQTNTPGLSDREGRYRRVVAVTLNHLISRRHVLSYAGTSSVVNLTASPADDGMKKIMRDCFGASNVTVIEWVASTGNAARDWSTKLTIAADQSLGPNVTKAYAWRNVLPLIQEIARDAAGLGTPVYFDIVMGAALPEFRTYVGVRGVDRSLAANQLVISAERGSLGGTVESTTDWSDSVTGVAAGGQGQGTERVLASAYDATRAGQSPFGLRELFIDATQLSNQLSLRGEASAELRRRRPTKILTGDLLSGPGAVYGLDWGPADKVLAEFERDSYVARVDSVTVTLDGGEETIRASIKGEAVA